MYSKNLTEEFRLRLTSVDMEFLRRLSEDRGMSISEIVRSIIGEYRRSVTAVDALNKAYDFLTKNGGLSGGDTKTNIDDKL